MYDCVMKFSKSYKTIIGSITICADENSITGVHFGTITDYGEDKETELIKSAFLQLNEYFDGKRQNFELPLKLEGTDFQKRVWENLKKIPYGKTWSYKELAIAAGNEKACRAAGMANNKNPAAIIVPCHRVVGADGKLVGYAAGLKIKKFLLDLESKHQY